MLAGSISCSAADEDDDDDDEADDDDEEEEEEEEMEEGDVRTAHVKTELPWTFHPSDAMNASKSPESSIVKPRYFAASLVRRLL